MQKILGFTVFSGQAKTVCNLLDAVPQRLPRTSLLSSLRIRAARWRECVYVLQSVFFVVVVVFFRPPREVHKYETTVLGNG